MSKFLAEDANQVLNNNAFKQSLERVEAHIDAKILACNPDNRDAAQRAIIAKQVTKGVIRELQRLIADAEAEAMIEELDPPKKRIFSRY